MFRFFIPLILFIFSAVLYVGYSQPNMDVIASVKEDIEFASSTLSIKKDEIELKREALEKARESIRPADRDRINRLAPSIKEFDEAAFINDMNNIALRHSMALKGMTVSGINTELEKEKTSDISSQYSTVSMSFSVSNTYTGIKSFLRELEKSEQLLDVTAISFGAASEEKESNYQITLNAYYWIP